MKVMYYIALLPAEGVRLEIRTLKLEVRDRFGSAHALRSPAHITLQMPFHFEEDNEEELLNALDILAHDERPFSCDMEGFGHFGNRTVFIEVRSNTHLLNLRTNLQTLLKENFQFGPKKLPQRFHPHITIANRDLTPENFDRCWQAFEKRAFQRNLTITGITLLKHRGDHWEPYHTSPFRDT